MAGPPAPGALVLDGSPRRLDPRARLRWMISRSVPWLILGLVALVVGLVGGQAVFGAIGLAALVALALLGVGSAVLSYRFWSWSAHEDALELRHGVVFRHLSVVPYHRIQQIDITRGPVERLLGLSTLVLRSAAATTDATVPGVDVAETEALRHALLARAGVDDAV